MNASRRQKRSTPSFFHQRGYGRNAGNASTRTARCKPRTHPSFLSLSPFFPFRSRNYSGVIAFHSPSPFTRPTRLTRLARKKKERTIRVTRTLLESKTERERELRARDASRCRSDATLQRAGICQFPFPRPPSIQFNATQSVNVTRMQPHTGVPRFAMKRPLFRPVLRC